MAELFLNRFKQVKFLGKGSSGKVYLVEDTENKNKFYALKIVDINNFQEYQREGARISMREEIQCMEIMKNSPNITTQYEYYYSEKEDTFYQILEYCEYGSLKQYQEKFPFKVFTLNQTIDILCQVLVGLEQLHMKGYIHRDLKVENILVTNFDNQQVFKVADFGFSKQSSDVKGTYLGSPCSMSPELLDCKDFRFRQTYGFQVDMWAFGVLFFYMLNHAFPFHTDRPLSADQLRRKAKNFSYRQCLKMIQSKPQTKGQYTYVCMDNCTEEVQDLFKRMFQIDPKQRITFQDIKKHSVFAPRFSALAEQCQTSQIRQTQGQLQIIIKGFECLNVVSTISVQNEDTVQEEEQPKSIFKFQIKYGFSKQYGILQGLKEEILFLKKIGVDFQNSKGLLKEYEASMISFTIHKYCAILIKCLKESLNKNYLNSKYPGFKWDSYLQSNEFLIVQRNIDNSIRLIQHGVSSLYNTCKKYLPEISKINNSFGSIFTKDIPEKAFEGNFKISYRQSTTYVYEMLRKHVGAKQENRINFFIAICLISHVFNQLYSYREQAAIIFPDYLKERKGAKNVSFYDLRGWINNTSADLLDKISKRILKTYFKISE